MNTPQGYWSCDTSRRPRCDLDPNTPDTGYQGGSTGRIERC